MSLTNIRLIVTREIRDQLRDRRTIFVIAILPLLFYPLLGMGFLQIMQFMREHPTKIWVIGGDDLPAEKQLVAAEGFRQDLLSDPSDGRLYEVSTEAHDGDVRSEANAAVQSGKYDAVIYLPPELRAYVAAEEADPESLAAAGAEVFYNAAKDKSRVAYDRSLLILSRWRADVIADRDAEAAVAKPGPTFPMVRHDLSQASGGGRPFGPNSCRSS